MDARNLLNRQRNIKGRRFAAKGRVNNKGNNKGPKRQGAISDLRQLISNQRGEQSSNVRNRLGFKSKNSMKAKTRGLQSNAAKNRALQNSRNPNKRFTLGSSLPRVVVKNNGNVRRDRNSTSMASWRPRRGGYQENVFVPKSELIEVDDVESPVSTMILSPSTLVPALSGSFQQIQVPTLSTMSTPQVGGTVLITNLNSTITDTDLLELFGDVGRLSSLQMVNSSTALVTYQNVADAGRACQTYNNRLLDGYPMSCTILPPTGAATQPAITARLGTNRAGTSSGRRTTAAQAFMDSGLLPRRSKKDVQFTVKI